MSEPDGRCLDASVFKKPLHPLPRKKMKVLSEDVYVKKLEEIVERDFFPDLPSIKDKLAFIEAKESNDFIKLRELYRKYANELPSQANPESSPTTFDTPLQSGEEEYTRRRGQADNDDDDRSSTAARSDQSQQKCLDSFLSAHTSEDNESFEKIMEDNERKLKLKYSWLYDAEEKHNASHAPSLALPSYEEQQTKAKLSISATSIPGQDVRPKSLENWTYKTFNSVMYVPEGAPLSEAQKLELAKVKKREVMHENTRFRTSPFTETVSPATALEASAIQAVKKEGRVGIDGKELNASTTPRFRGYGLVAAPSPFPGMAGESPLMTWGELDSTPYQLDGPQTPLCRGRSGSSGPTYKIPKEPERDKLLHELTDKASQTHRDRKLKAMQAAKANTPSPVSITPGFQKNTSECIGSMSGAAQRLLSSRISSKGIDLQLRASYTPSPQTSRFTPKSPISIRADHNSRTPAISTGLTDNLLNLPVRSHKDSLCNNQPQNKRQCAADFF